MRLALFSSVIFGFRLFISHKRTGNHSHPLRYGAGRDSRRAPTPKSRPPIKQPMSSAMRWRIPAASSPLPVYPWGATRSGFSWPVSKTHINDAVELSAGQTVRQTFTLEVGQLAENSPSPNAPRWWKPPPRPRRSRSATKEVRRLPLARRNITDLLSLTTGVTEASTGLAGGGNIRLNGVAEGGTAVTVDGTDATANNETRGINLRTARRIKSA